MLRKRSHQLELLDLGPAYYTAEEYRHCLIQLDRIGRYLGGDRATRWAIDRLPNPPTSILDVGCGGGSFTRRLAQNYPEAQVVGLEISDEAIAFANGFPSLSNLTFSLTETPDLSFPSNHFDVVTSTLVCHHMSDDELVNFLRKAFSVSKQAVILNDLHRHPIALAGFAVIAPLFFANRLILHDGILSIKRSFTRQDWLSVLQKAEIPLEKCTITWHWPFRWIVTIQKDL